MTRNCLLLFAFIMAIIAVSCATQVALMNYPANGFAVLHLSTNDAKSSKSEWQIELNKDFTDHSYEAACNYHVTYLDDTGTPKTMPGTPNPSFSNGSVMTISFDANIDNTTSLVGYVVIYYDIKAYPNGITVDNATYINGANDPVKATINIQEKKWASYIGNIDMTYSDISGSVGQKSTFLESFILTDVSHAFTSVRIEVLNAFELATTRNSVYYFTLATASCTTQDPTDDTKTITWNVEADSDDGITVYLDEKVTPVPSGSYLYTCKGIKLNQNNRVFKAFGDKFTWTAHIEIDNEEDSQVEDNMTLWVSKHNSATGYSLLIVLSISFIATLLLSSVF